MDDQCLICSCMNVTVKDIKAAILSGARSFEEVQEITQACTVCQGCEEDLRIVIKRLLENI